MLAAKVAGKSAADLLRYGDMSNGAYMGMASGLIAVTGLTKIVAYKKLQTKLEAEGAGFVRLVMHAHPSSLSDYTLLKFLGKGTFGTANKVRHRRTGITYALKTIACDPTGKINTMTTDEAYAETDKQQGITSPYVCRVETHGCIGQTYWILMELCEGGELYDYIRRQDAPRLPEGELLRLWREIAVGLRDVHANNIIHRDLYVVCPLLCSIIVCV
jgi:serine/threonine protein kinase